MALHFCPILSDDSAHPLTGLHGKPLIQILVASAINLKSIKSGKTSGSIDENSLGATRCGRRPKKRKWRREGDSNALNTALLFRVTECDNRSQIVTSAFNCNGIFSFQLPSFSDRL